MKRKVFAVLTVWGILTGTAGAVGHIADVTVYDRAENRMLPVHRHHGRYYVVGRPGNEYQISVRNRSGGDVLAVVSVDGVNAVSGETADWGQTGYVLAPNQAFDIKGWRKSLQRVAAFFFTEHQNSYAARTGRPANVGVIGVAVYRRKAEPEARILRDRARENSAEPRAGAGPAADDAARAAESDVGRPASPSVGKSASLGTGHGRSEASRVTYTQFERATASPEEVIAIHYDTFNNLVAMGAIRGPWIAAPSPSPSPFPGQFVPDPR
jgi:hypothetical protein